MWYFTIIRWNAGRFPDHLWKKKHWCTIDRVFWRILCVCLSECHPQTANPSLYRYLLVIDSIEFNIFHCIKHNYTKGSVLYLIQIYIEIVVAQLHDEQIVGALVLNCLMSKLDINVVYGLQTEENFSWYMYWVYHKLSWREKLVKCSSYAGTFSFTNMKKWEICFCVISQHVACGLVLEKQEIVVWEYTWEFLFKSDLH